MPLPHDLNMANLYQREPIATIAINNVSPVWMSKPDTPNGVSHTQKPRPTYWLSSTTLGQWKKTAQSISERCDLSGLSCEPMKYQLASTGMDGKAFANVQRTIVIADELLVSVRDTCAQRQLSSESMALFAVHQMLKAFGNGSHTVTATFVPRPCKPREAQAWTVFPTTSVHKGRESQSVARAMEDTRMPMGRKATDLVSIMPNELFRLELLDLMVVFDGAVQDASLPDFPLILRITIQDQAWQLTMQYADELFDMVVVDSLLDALRTMLIAATQPRLLVGDIELLPEAQIAQLDEWNNTDGDYPSTKRLHHLVEEAVVRCENKVAIVCGEKQVTYKALNEEANRLAHYLCSVGIQPEQLVGLFLDKNDHMVATILGIWKSGAAYVPIDPAYPDERVRFVLDDTKVRVVIASERHVRRIQSQIEGLWIITLEHLVESLHVAQQQHQSLTTTRNLTHLSLNSKQLAYVTYTSGTTGFPKGIYKEHTSVVNSITDLCARYGVAGARKEVILLFSAYVFEPFVRQMLMALTTGHQLAIIGDEEKFDPDILIPFIQRQRVSNVHGTASVLQEYDFTACPSLRRMILVGENLTSARYAALRRRFKGRIFNEYGFTESAFVTALKEFEPASVRINMSLGQPVRNVKCYILDSSLKRVPLGVMGELYIGGLGISRGYMNRDELTRQRFLRNPYQNQRELERCVNGLMYKTGDLARWLPNGEVEYLGRADFQIKLRGIRIEPGEIESTLAMYPGVRTSIVVSRKLLGSGQETSQEHLVGYFVCDEQTLSENDLLVFLEKKLPRYMIPTRLVQLPHIPVTINGKADLRALPNVQVSMPSSSISDEGRGELEETLAKIWGDVLGVPSQRIGIEQTCFFRLGGHSIACIQLIARVRQHLGLGISLEEVFRTRTLRNMADLLRVKEAESPAARDCDADHAGNSSRNASNVRREERLLANSLQQGFVYHSLKTQQSDAYIMQSTLNYRVPLEPDLYRAAWEAVQRHHPALRLRFAWDEADVIQVVDPESHLDWRLTAGSTDTEDEKGRQLLLQQTIEDGHTGTFHLDKGSLIRISLVRLAQAQYSCIFRCHHSILDGWSLPLLFEYVHEAYLGLRAGTPLPIKEDTAYLDSQRYLEAHRNDHLMFWEEQIAQIEERCDMNSLLNEASRYKVPLADYDQIKEQRQQTTHLPWGAAAAELKEECSSRGITLHSILQLVWHLALHAYGGGGHTITGTTISGRNLPVVGIERALGLFINTLPLIIDHSSYRDKTVLEAIAHVQSQVNAMNSRGNVELGRLCKNNLKHGLFDSLFVLENYPNLNTSRRARHQELLNYDVEGGTEKLSYPLAVIAQENGDNECSFTLCYAGELFTDDTIKALLSTVRDTFENIAQNIHAPVCDIEYLSTGQLMQLGGWNATQAEYPGGTLHSLFESEAQHKPEKIAVVYEDARLTYRELNCRANALAHHLLSKVPILPNQLVALVTDKSEHLFTSILAVWKSGGAYVPIDPGYPDDRIRFILDDTRALAVVADLKYLSRLRSITQNSMPLIQSDMALHLPLSPAHPVSCCTPSDLAYVIYTSGTTGRPKGVMVEHHGVVNLATSLSQTFGLRDTDDEVILSFSNYVFDHFIEQMTDALLNGQTLLVLNDDMRGDKERLYRYIEANRVTYLSGTPSVISMYEFSRFQGHLRRIDCVGEAFSEPVFDKIRETFSGLIINGYGPTEVSITTHKRLYPFPERRSDKSIGRQIANSTSYVLNEDMKRLPIGAVGELYLGGDGVARGYHNRPDLTADRFPANPFQTEQEKQERRNGRLYRTGDLVRWIQSSNGEVEYIGRNDFQVKIRGQRIELGEIEAVLSSHPEIEQSVVLARDGAGDGQKYLIGYYVSPASLSSQAIRRYMQTRLPAYMVPSRLVPMVKLPVTVSGKLDTKALPVPADTAEDDVLPPRTEVERILAGIWADVLEMPVESIGIYSDFFGLGGDSLKSTKLSFTATHALGVTVGVDSLFRHPTIAALAHCIVSGSANRHEIPALQDTSLANVPVSPAQERLLFLHAFNGGGDAYNIAVQLQLEQAPCLQSLEKALRAVVSRHEALRTLLVRSQESSRHCQKILDAHSAQQLFSVQVLQLSVEDNMPQRMSESAQHVFCLDAEIPLHVRLYQIHGEDGTRNYASLVFHHSAFDAWSWDVFQRDLRAYYTAYVGYQSAVAANLPKLRVQYKEYSVEHRKTLASERCRILADFWARKLSSFEPLCLATDRPRPVHFEYAGNDLHVSLDVETTKRLKFLARQEGTSLYNVMLAAYCFLLGVYTNQQDVSLGIPMAHRNHPDFESVIGFFVNLLPLRVNVSQPTVRELIRVVQREVIDAQIHQDMPFQEITKLLHVELDPSRHPLVQTVFNFEVDAAGKAAEARSLFWEYCPPSPLPSVAKFDLNATVKDSATSLSICFNYATSLFEEETVRGFLRTYQHLLQQMAHNAADSNLAVLSIADQQPLEQCQSDDSANTGHTDSLRELFEYHAAATPDRIAVADGVRRISYFELNTEANRLAQLIAKSREINADDCIALMLDKSIDMVISILAVWKVGAAYVPLDPSYPTKRVHLILQEASPRLLITMTKYIPSAESAPVVHAIALDAPEVVSSLEQQPTDNLALCWQQPFDLAYVIFTSGTTGKPKGVLVEQRSVMRLREALVDRYFGCTNGSHTVLFLSNYAFDFSVEQLVLSILSGNKLIIPPEHGLTHEKFYELANAEQLSYLSGTPSVLQQIQLSRLRHVQLITAAGEEFHRSQYEDMRAQFRGPINNAYGITETTIYNIVTTFEGEARFTKALCDELPGSHAFVLNDRLQRVPVNAVGELYLAGDCVARGYLNQDALTNERYIPNPFCSHRESGSCRCTRLYKTGDLVCYRGPNGLEFLGRRDQQVKLRGFRIELAEIRDALSSIPGVNEAAIIPRYDRDQSSSPTITGLIGYYTMQGHGALRTPSDVRDRLITCLPHFMVPSQLYCLQGSLPVTVNGKLDVGRLHVAGLEQREHLTRYGAPRNSLESKLCHLWASLLGMDHCGIDDDLFARGADSISSLQLVGLIYRQLERKVTVKDIFLHRTVRALHDNVLALDQEHGLLPPLRADQALVEGDAPLLPIQRWFLSKPLHHPGYWNHCFTIRTPVLDISRLREAVQLLQHRHDMLRMRLRPHEEGFVQTFPRDCAPAEVHEVDVAGLESPKAVIQALSEAQSHFNMEQGPLFAVAYLSGYPDRSCRIWFALHHLIVDTVSWNILLSDLQTLYHGGGLGMKSSSVQQWALAVCRYTISSAERTYWDAIRESVIRNAQSLPPCEESTIRYEDKLDRAETVSLFELCTSRLSVGVQEILLMAVGSALQKITGDAPTVVTIEGHGREDSVDPSLDVSRTVGWFTSMYPFEIPQVKDLVQGVIDVKESMLRVPSRGIGYGPSYGYDRGSLPAVSVNYLGRLDQDQSRCENWTLAVGEGEYPHGLFTSPEDAEHSSSMVDFTFFAVEQQLTVLIKSRWGSGATEKLLCTVQSVLRGLIEIAAHADFHPPSPSSLDVDFTPYFIFDDGARQGTPLFLLPPGEGGAESYFNNIVQGLPHRTLVVFNNYYRHSKSMATFEELAGYYLSHMRSVQSEGPYHVLGWSFGGILALELAQQLTNHGERIGTMALIDPYFDISSATKAIGRGDCLILDPIYHNYHPDRNRFQAVETLADNIILYKATTKSDRYTYGTLAQKALYDWYVECPMNNLDKYVDSKAIQLVPLEGTHFTWVHHFEQVRSMCALLEKCVE